MVLKKKRYVPIVEDFGPIIEVIFPYLYIVPFFPILNYINTRPPTRYESVGVFVFVLVLVVVVDIGFLSLCFCPFTELATSVD